MVFSDLSSGILYGTTEGLDTVAANVYALPVIDGESGVEYPSMLELARAQTGETLPRVDPRFFRFPNGDPGVLLESTGDYYLLSELKPKKNK